MNSIRLIFHVFKGQFFESILKSRVFAGYLIGISLAVYGVYSYSGYACENVFQVFEPYILNYSNIAKVTFVLLGFVFILSDAPFINNRSMLVIYRVGRKKWYISMIFYIITHAIIYYILPLIISVLLVMNQSYSDNMWSATIHGLFKHPNNPTVYAWKVAIPPEALLKEYSPYSALAHTIALLFFYSMFIGIILLVFNMAFSKAVGTVIVAIIHVIGYMMAFDGIVSVLAHWSMFFNSVFLFVISLDDRHGIIFSYCFFLFFILLVFEVGYILIKTADFRYSLGEEYV